MKAPRMVVDGVIDNSWLASNVWWRYWWRSVPRKPFGRRNWRRTEGLHHGASQLAAGSASQPAEDSAEAPRHMRQVSMQMMNECAHGKDVRGWGGPQ